MRQNAALCGNGLKQSVKKALNIKKGEIGSIQHFLLFQQCFLNISDKNFPQKPFCIKFNRKCSIKAAQKPY